MSNNKNNFYSYNMYYTSTDISHSHGLRVIHMSSIKYWWRFLRKYRFSVFVRFLLKKPVSVLTSITSIMKKPAFFGRNRGRNTGFSKNRFRFPIPTKKACGWHTKKGMWMTNLNLQVLSKPYMKLLWQNFCQELVRVRFIFIHNQNTFYFYFTC